MLGICKVILGKKKAEEAATEGCPGGSGPVKSAYKKLFIYLH